MVEYVVPNDSLRVKVADTCNLNCGFCHHEGGGRSDRLMLDQLAEILSFAKKFGFRKIHFTGGEPTLHQQIAHMVRSVKMANLACGLTSNGLCPTGRLHDLRDAGLDGMNISLHTIRPEEWCSIQGHANTDLAQKQIDWVLGTIRESCQIGLNTRVNIVVAQDPGPAMEVIEALINDDAEIRLLSALGVPGAVENIDWILDYYEASFVEAKYTQNTSQSSRTYMSRVGPLVVKCVRENRLASVCAGCQERCLEGAYGIRLESLGGLLHARLCVQNENARTLQALDEFQESPQLVDMIK